MGITTQEMSSLPLSSKYASRYKETQIINWTCADLVVTESNGDQFPLPRTLDIREESACVIIEERSHTGLRSKENGIRMEEMPIKGVQWQIPFGDIRTQPIHLEKFNIYISTAEQAILAKEFVCKDKYVPSMVENRYDLDISDPRLVFQVVDTANRWDLLYVSVFGQVMVLRSGKFGQIIPSDKPVDGPGEGKLVCYLRYPSGYCNATRDVQTLFEIDLKNLNEHDVYRLDSGENICVATTMEGLQESIRQCASGYRGSSVSTTFSDKMIPKEIYDAAIENYKSEIERLKESHKTAIETVKTQLGRTIADLQFKLTTVTNEKLSSDARAEQWKGLHTAKTEFYSTTEKARQETFDTTKKQLETMSTFIKIGGTICASVLSFAITVLVKTKK